MSMADLTINPERSTVVDFSYPFWFELSGVAVKVKFNAQTEMNKSHEYMPFSTRNQEKV